MVELEAGEEQSIMLIWDTYRSFEDLSYNEDDDLEEFMSEWQGRMCSALSAGCQYSDPVLAFKLLEKTNLNPSSVNAIVRSLTYPVEGHNLLSQTVTKIQDLLKTVKAEKDDRVRSKIFLETTRSSFSPEKHRFIKTHEPDPFDDKSGIKPHERVDRLATVADLTDFYLEDERNDDPDDVDAIEIKLENGKSLLEVSSLTEEYFTGNMDFTRCPKCNKNLSSKDDPSSGERKPRGKLTCSDCGVHIALEGYFSGKYTHGSRLMTKREPGTGEVSEATSTKQTRKGNPGPKTRKNSFQCENCDKKFRSEERRRHHMKMVHKTELETGTTSELEKQELPGSTYQCEDCPRQFLSQEDFGVHQREHRGEPSYQCEVCGKSFANRTLMKAHSRSHSKERTYSCDICNKSFKQSTHLKVHIRRHTGEKPWVCDYCGRAFTQQSTWIEHKRLHTGEKPYECEDCGKTFAHAAGYKCHRRIHTGEKPYKCKFCGHAFRRPGGLIVHLRIHTGEKPFSCLVCGKAFADSSVLKRHQKIHSTVADSSPPNSRSIRTAPPIAEPNKDDLFMEFQ